MLVGLVGQQTFFVPEHAAPRHALQWVGKQPTHGREPQQIPFVGGMLGHCPALASFPASGGPPLDDELAWPPEEVLLETFPLLDDDDDVVAPLEDALDDELEELDAPVPGGPLASTSAYCTSGIDEQASTARAAPAPKVATSTRMVRVPV